MSSAIACVLRPLGPRRTRPPCGPEGPAEPADAAAPILGSLSGGRATATNCLKLWTVSGVPPKVAVSGTAPTFFPLIVSVWGSTAKSGTVLLITGMFAKGLSWLKAFRMLLRSILLLGSPVSHRFLLAKMSGTLRDGLAPVTVRKHHREPLRGAGS